jgi:PPOX class probable F420-dependent enzyme
VTDAGRPHLVPCCFVLEEETIYSAVNAKPKSTPPLPRLANIAANRGVALLVDHHYDEDWSLLWWVRLDGVAPGGGRPSRACLGPGPPYGEVPAVRAQASAG